MIKIIKEGKLKIIQKHLLSAIFIGLYTKYIKDDMKIIVSKTKINFVSGLIFFFLNLLIELLI